MKRFFLCIVVVMMVTTLFGVHAEMGVQLIGGPDASTETEAVSLDDVKLGTAVTIDGYGKLTLTDYSCVDYANGIGASLQEGEFAVLYMDILNTTTSSKDYLSSCGVKMIYDDTYEFSGWAQQFDWDSSTDFPVESPFEINPMYIGHYAFGCKIPNAVVERKAPLKMIITLDDNEITYNVRK